MSQAPETSVRFTGDPVECVRAVSIYLYPFLLALSMALMGLYFSTLFLVLGLMALGGLWLLGSRDYFTLDDQKRQIVGGHAGSISYEKVRGVSISAGKRRLRVTVRGGAFGYSVLAEGIPPAERERLLMELEQRFPGLVKVTEGAGSDSRIALLAFAGVCGLYGVFHFVMAGTLPEAVAPIGYICPAADTKRFAGGAVSEGGYTITLPEGYREAPASGSGAEYRVFVSEDMQTTLALFASPRPETPALLKALGVCDMVDIYRIAGSAPFGALPVMSRAYFMRGVASPSLGVCSKGRAVFASAVSGAHLGIGFTEFLYAEAGASEDLRVFIRTHQTERVPLDFIQSLLSGTGSAAPGR